MTDTIGVRFGHCGAEDEAEEDGSLVRSCDLPDAVLPRTTMSPLDSPRRSSPWRSGLSSGVSWVRELRDGAPAGLTFGHGVHGRAGPDGGGVKGRALIISRGALWLVARPPSLPGRSLPSPVTASLWSMLPRRHS